MTDALKAAVREAIGEIPYASWHRNWLGIITSALARRGVVVAGESHNQGLDAAVSDALQSIAYVLSDLNGNIINDTQFSESVDKITRSLMPKGIIGSACGGSTALHALREGCVLPSPAAGESPAPKPKLTIVQMMNDDGREVVLCDDGSMFRNDIDGNWRAYKPIPQPGDEQ